MDKLTTILNAMKGKKAVILFVTLLFALSAGLVLASSSAGSSSKKKSSAKHAIHWGYTGSAGPSAWGHLSATTKVCGSGKRQSPIDLKDASSANLYDLHFNYRPNVVKGINNGHTLQENYDTYVKSKRVEIGGKWYASNTQVKKYDSELLIGDASYKLLQFHFHSPSEHAVDHKRYAMEVHLVHKNASGNLAVVGIFLKRGRHNPTLGTLLEKVSNVLKKEVVSKDDLVNAMDLLPSNKEVYHYTGSLTTPPCSENVNWFVMKNPIEVSNQQVQKFISLVGENARPLQTMNWRKLFVSQ